MFKETPNLVRSLQALFVLMVLLNVWALTRAVSLIPVLGIAGFGLFAVSYQLRYRRLNLEAQTSTKAAGTELHLLIVGAVALLVRFGLQISA
jgi:hypothetical protein